MSLGFGFLERPASFDIGEAPIRYTPDSPFRRAIFVGLVNTAKVAVVGWFLATTLGFVLGILRLADNPAVRGLTHAWVELMRNIPLLLLVLLFATTLHTLPSARGAIELIPNIYISNRGVVFPYIELRKLHLMTAVLAFVTLLGLRQWGRARPVLLTGALVVLGVSLAVSPPVWNVPRLGRFDFVGGLGISAEFAALLAALVLHHSAHISEVLRGAIVAVPRGQREAALSLGLSRLQALRFVILPQALRAMVPLLASACVSLTKNSSLAVAIGFPDVVSVLNTTANQTGHTIEVMLIMIVVYLSLSLAVAAALNAYNSRLLRRGAPIS